MHTSIMKKKFLLSNSQKGRVYFDNVSKTQFSGIKLRTLKLRCLGKEIILNYIVSRKQTFE